MPISSTSNLAKHQGTGSSGEPPPLASNYNKAVACLRARFGREGLLVEFYVREMLKLTMSINSKEEKVTLSSLYDRIETQLRALETLWSSHREVCSHVVSTS